MRHPATFLSLLLLVAAFIGHAMAKDTNCFASGYNCILDPGERGEITIAVMFCSACCKGFTSLNTIQNTGVSA